ncbi:MAG: MBL fold metallo-hydrolase [Polyangiaceae bacterium]
MGVFEIERGVWGFSRWIFNCWIVESDAGGVVFDPGLASSAAAVLDWAREHPIAALTATHLHSDHVGGMPALARSTKAPVRLPERARRYVEDGERPRSPGLREVARIARVFGDQPFDVRAIPELIQGSRAAGYSGLSCKWPRDLSPASYLADGDSLPGAPSWRVLRTAGHTDDSTCFFNEERGVLISGDAVLGCGGRAWFNPELTDTRLARETEARLRELRVELLLPGHGRWVRGADVMRDARSSR